MYAWHGALLIIFLRLISLSPSSWIFFRSSFSDFVQKHGKDDRFKGIEKSRDRESLFNEFILEVRRREKDEKLQKKETVSMKIRVQPFLHILIS